MLRILGPCRCGLTRSRLLTRSTATQTDARGAATYDVDGLRARARPSPGTLSELAKPKLTTLIVLSTMASYAIAPGETSLTTLGWLTAGTALCSSSANAFNMWLEPPFDAQMSRTKNRPLVRGAVHPDQAFAIGTTAGVIGTAALYIGVNPLCAALGLANVALYAGVYTPLKRHSILNTWAGAVVGAIPPLMGWFAASPYPVFDVGNLGGLYLGLLLYAWQFPHFNSLAWYIRGEYARAGYVMASVTDPALNARVSLRYAVACLPICTALVHAQVCDTYFLFDSTCLNAFLILRAWQFWQVSTNAHLARTGGRTSGNGSDEAASDKAARKLFFASLVYLPALLVLAMLHKRGAVSRPDNDNTQRAVAVRCH